MPTTTATLLDTFHDFQPDDQDFLSAVVDGLAAERKSIPSKFFYDEAGSRLFDEICGLAEYYPTRTEMLILEKFKDQMAALAGTHCHLVELGSGSSIKTRTLMQALDRPLGYIPIDISRDHLMQSAQSFSQLFADVPVAAICADYTTAFDLPAIAVGQYVGFYPGSTIGNFTPDEAVVFLQRLKHKLNGGGLLIGVDLIKDTAILNAAYDDARGVTAAFNKNLLVRCNRELGADFELAAFAHRAFYNEAECRIEMHLVSTRAQQVGIADQVFAFAEDETIHTENSYKYSIDGFHTLARRAGLTPVQVWTDPAKLFSVHYLSAG
ncbi:MAG: L-histidine N(alpha)-methyltransferase [Rhodospirillales bacterium]|nr:L-histidine N(alpha)-methyltransferase [Rhodospirillales bacterium]